MTLLGLLCFLLIIALVLWLANKYLPEPFKMVVNIVVVVGIILWLLSMTPLAQIKLF